MKVAPDQVVWPLISKSTESVPKIESENQGGLSFVDASDSLHLNLDSTDFSSRQVDTPIEKCKIRKRRLLSEDGETVDGDGPNEKQSIMRWKDEWVAQLIHIKGRAQVALSVPQKQRVDLWQVIKNEMARACQGFDKDSEACRKKWRRVYKEYKDDKCLRMAGNSSQKCKFYELMDLYMGERTSAVNNSQLMAIGYNDSHAFSPMKGSQLAAGEEHLSIESQEPAQTSAIIFTFHGGHPIPSAGSAQLSKKPFRRSGLHATGDESGTNLYQSSSLRSLLAEFAGLGKVMLDITKQYEQETVDALHSMKNALHEISKQI
ncbi:hypothetical protein KP509_10G066900 [Ceratopteris richardii]|uniref:Myb/SANT-like DNA-binding domain-containing protein n=1 Tax=Ceratopteris richardii TaxID=49495 RepID=A0A8T2U1Z5_CERRI|nr:hypothetical protein KP509_10G066900 [Ceratopteris richardii]